MNIERGRFETESDIDGEDEGSILKLCNTSIWEDLWGSLYDARFAGPFVALLGIIIAFHITIAPFRAHVEPRDDLSSTSLNLDLVSHSSSRFHLQNVTVSNNLQHTVRPVIEEGRMWHIRDLLMHAGITCYPHC